MLAMYRPTSMSPFLELGYLSPLLDNLLRTEMNLTASSIKIFLSKGGSALIVFIGIAFFAQSLGPSELGSFFLFQTALYLLTIPADFGIRGGVEKRLSEGMDPGDILASAICCKIVTLSIVISLILLLRDAIVRFIGADLVLALILGVILWEFSQLYIQAIRGEMRVGETAILEFSHQFIWIVAGGILVYFGYGVLGIVYGMLFGLLVASVAAYAVANIPLGKPSNAHIHSLVDYAKYHFISESGGQVYEWMDVALIGIFLSSAQVGIYEVAWQVTLVVLIASYSVATTIFPQVSSWSAEAANDRIERLISRTLGVVLAVSIPAFIGATVFSEDILQYLFGAEYVVAAGVLIILMAEKVFQSANDVFWRSLNAINRPDLGARATVITVIVNLVLNLLLIPTYGIVGAACATTFAVITNTLLHGYYLSRFLEVRIPYKLVSICLTISIVMAAELTVVRSLLPVQGIIMLFLQIAIGALIYAILMVSIPSIRREFIVPGINALR